MKKITALTLLVLALVVPLVFGAGTRAAQAAPPTPASGSFQDALLANVVTRSAGPNTIITDTLTTVLSGTFSGTSVLQERYVLRADGSFIDHAVETFTGTVNGVAGTVTEVDVLTGDATSFHGHFVVVSGTGGLANLHGQGTFEGSTITGAGTYTGQIHQ
ncbi:MAG: DUF3224 domain-containing protein [Chloroflexota bacterium]|nr:DUF3224 domain-containing protein [Chloroflexota bacterium]